MRTVLLVSLLVACAPPPPVDIDGSASSEPSLELLFPDDNVTTRLVCGPNPAWDCEDGADNTNVDAYVDSIEMMLVVDIDNLELINPYSGNVQLVDGQGHYHIYVDGVQLTSASDQVYELLEPAPPGIVGGQRALVVDLRDNLHGEIGPASDTVEVSFLANSEDCSVRVEDFCP